MRVIHIYDGHEQVYGGDGSVPEVVWNIARETAAAGHDVTVLERQWEGLPAQACHEGVDFHRMNLWTGADKPWTRVPYEMVDSPLAMLRLVGDRTWFAVKVLHKLNQLSFDILHVHLPFAANVLVTLAPWLRDKMIYTAHVGEEDKRFDLGSDDETPAALQYFSPDIYLMNRVAYNTVLNPDLYSNLQDHTNISNMEVIPNGVDLEEFPASEREVEEVKNRYDLSKVSVLFAGSVTPRKGVDTLIEAANIANRKLKCELKIILVGNKDIDAEFVFNLEEEIKENDIENIIEFAGFVPWNDLKGLYSACDIFTLPSREEGFGMVVTEALASGKPVIGTNVGGIQSQVIDGDNGFLIEPGSSQELAQKLIYLATNDEERERMGDRSREIAESEFGWENVTEKYHRLYKRVDD